RGLADPALDRAHRDLVRARHRAADPAQPVAAHPLGLPEPRVEQTAGEAVQQAAPPAFGALTAEPDDRVLGELGRGLAHVTKRSAIRAANSYAASRVAGRRWASSTRPPVARCGSCGISTTARLRAA